MLAECGLCLAIDFQQKNIKDEKNWSVSGGVLTPASALGMAGIQRMRESGMIFEIVENFDKKK